MFFELSVIAIVIYWVYDLWIKKPARFPPGPPRVPLLGSIPFMKGPTVNEKIWGKDLVDK